MKVRPEERRRLPMTHPAKDLGSGWGKDVDPEEPEDVDLERPEDVDPAGPEDVDPEGPEDVAPTSESEVVPKEVEEEATYLGSLRTVDSPQERYRASSGRPRRDRADHSLKF